MVIGAEEKGATEAGIEAGGEMEAEVGMEVETEARGR